jgi:hypothetical protein
MINLQSGSDLDLFISAIKGPTRIVPRLWAQETFSMPVIKDTLQKPETRMSKLLKATVLIEIEYFLFVFEVVH